jgi:hypothetical protein
LVDQRKSREQLEVQAQQVESPRNYARVARLRFDNGYTSYIEVLDAERSFFSAELSLAQTKGVLFQAPMNLYKAMSGGWVLEADHLTGTTTDSKISMHYSEVLHANQWQGQTNCHHGGTCGGNDNVCLRFAASCSSASRP